MAAAVKSYRAVSMQPSRSNPRGIARSHRTFRAVAQTLLRLLIALAAIQVAGLSLCAACVSGDDDLGCPASCTDNDQDQGGPCPPFCPTCTCAHARPLSIGQFRIGGMLPLPRIAVLHPVGFSEQSPESPDPDPYFRPPRPGRV